MRVPAWYQRPMRLLSDFDGVWTHPRAEAESQGRVLDDALAGLVPEHERAEVRAWIADARRAVAAEPTLWGWAPGGRITAFADEDPFAPHSALLHYIGVQAHEDAVVHGHSIAHRLRDAVVAGGHRTLEAFGGWCHVEGVRRVVSARGPAILPDARDVAAGLLSVADVVVVSNSTTAKLQEWFGHAGLATTVHPESRPGAFRLRGSARKFELSPAESEWLDLGALRVDVARPMYLDALREEAPDAVVGDVFSIDLALPLVLKRNDPAWRHVRLFWLARDYAPAWLASILAELAPEVEIVRDGLPGVARALGAV